MPLLPREPYQFPPDLFNPQYLAQQTEREWWVLYTLARREKDLMRRLLANGAAFYCPVVSKRSRAPSGRVQVSHIPLFANYVFLYGDELARYRALTTGCVAQTLPVTDAAEMTRQLQQIERLIASGYELQPHRHIESGERVRMRRGPLRGVEGTMLHNHGDSRLLVAVDVVRQGASLAIDDADLEWID
jgi:transcription antitermination factor NusG